MSMAPPGRLSGIHYIILGNIPKRRKDYELKAFVEKSGYQVVHAHIHPNLGCDYVSVDDRDYFSGLGQWLEAAEWEGKTLQVDLRNHDHDTALGPGSHPSLGSSTSRSGSSGQSSISPNGSGIGSSGMQVQYAPYQPHAQVPMSPAYTTVQSGFAQQYTYANTPMTYSAAPLMQAPAYATNHMSPVITSLYQYADPSQYHPAPAQHQIPISYSQSSYSPTATMRQPAAQARPANARTVPTCKRLLHCTRVPGCDSKSEISRKVQSVLSSKEVSPIEHIWIPTRPHDGSKKGHPLILMRSRALAEKVIARLEDAKITGKDGKTRSMKLKIAQDGVSEADLEQLNVGDTLSRQMNGMSLQPSVTTGTPKKEMGRSGQSFDSSTAMYETASNDSAPNTAAQDDEVPGIGQGNSSLPTVNGSSRPSKIALEKVEKEGKWSKDREKSSTHGHMSSHHTSSSKSSGSSGSKKSRK